MKSRILLLSFICGLLTTLSADAQLLARHAAIGDDVFEEPDPAYPLWHRAPVERVNLLAQTVTRPSADTISTPFIEARAIHNGQWLAVLLTWHDQDRNDILDAAVYGDAVAMSWPLRGAATSPFMGDPNMPIEIVHWKAAWQRDVDEGYRDVAEAYPNMTVDAYHGSKTGKPHPLKDVLESPEALNAMPAIQHGNPVSQVDRTWPVEQLTAAGFTGTLTTLPEQRARARGVHENGRWHVLITRPLNTKVHNNLPLVAGMDTLINFAVWEGSRGDVGSRKSYTMWVPFRLEVPR